MPSATLQRPDVLVLGAGGILGEAWMTGALAGIEAATGIDFRDCEYLVGTSAGSIVAASLAAGRRPSVVARLQADDDRVEPVARAFDRASAWALGTASRVALAAAAPIAPLAMATAAPGGALLRAALLAAVPAPRGSLADLGRSVQRAGARFDGRLRIVVVDRRRGRRVVLGAPGAPRASVGEAVEASCAVPWLFRSVEIAGRQYVDGGVWSPTNLDVAPTGRDSEVLCLVPAVSFAGLPWNASGALRLGTRTAVTFERASLLRRGARVRVIAPSRAAGEAMGEDFMDRARREDALLAGFRQGRALAAAAPAAASA